MQLFAELPDLVAMFLCGFVGYMSVEWVKRRVAANARHRQKLEGLCETKATMNPLDLATCEEETMEQPDQKQPNPRTQRLRSKKAARKACKAIHPVAAHEEPPCAGNFNMDSSGANTTAVNFDAHHLAKNMPAAGTSVTEKPPPLVMVTEMARGSLQENANAPADDGSAAGWECMTVNIDDAEADDEAEAEAVFATNMKEAGADDHKRPQGWCADAERACQQAVLNREPKPQIQGDGMEETEQLMAHDKSESKKTKKKHKKQKEQETETETTPEQNEEGEDNLEGLVGEKEEPEHVQKEMELLHATPEKQCGLCEPDLAEWPETTDDEGSLNDHSSQLQQDDDHLSREEERRRVLTSDWSDAQDEEEWSESVYDAMHHSCLCELDWSSLQHGTSEHDTWSMPFANDEVPPSQLINSSSGKGKQHTDNWMTPFAPADRKVSGWFTDDQNDGDLPGWLTEAKWPWEQQSKSHQGENDFWMTPFDELIQQAAPHTSAASTAPSMNSPMGPAVCIWNAGGSAASDEGGDSSEGNGAAEIFTDGQQVFQPVPSATGQPLFTDGKQLYASVCVVVGPPDEGADPTLGYNM